MADKDRRAVVADLKAPDYPHLFIFYNQSIMMIWYGCQPLRIHARAGVPKGFTGFQRLDLLWGTWNRFNINPMIAGNMLIYKI